MNQPQQSPFERYQSKPFFGSSHWWALGWISTLKSTARALDIGPGSGVLGQALHDRGIGDSSAVEIDPATREKLEGLYRQVAGTLDDLSVRTYDFVLLMDVLEHMSQPEEFLKRLLPLLNPGGTLLVSVPNIAHWSIRLSLLLGKFDYTDRGILDRTHLQHFTKDRIIGLLGRFPSLRVKEYSISIVPVELLLAEGVRKKKSVRLFLQFFGKLRRTLGSYLPGLCAYQHLIALEKVV